MEWSKHCSGPAADRKGSVSEASSPPALGPHHSSGDISEAGWPGPRASRGEHAAGTRFIARASVRSPLSGGPFRQGGQTIHGSQSLSPWEPHRKKQLCGACPCPQGVPSLAEGPGGRCPRCTGLRAECGAPLPCLHQQKAPQRLPVVGPVGPDQVLLSLLSRSPAASSPVWPLWPHPLTLCGLQS